MDNKIISAREKVANEVLSEIIDGLNSGSLSVAQAREAARLTLVTLDKIEKHEDSITDFYKMLSLKYPSFKILYTKVRSQILKARELSAYHNALMAIEAGKIGEAKDIIEVAIAASAHETTNVN